MYANVRFEDECVRQFVSQWAETAFECPGACGERCRPISQRIAFRIWAGYKGHAIFADPDARLIIIVVSTILALVLASLFLLAQRTWLMIHEMDARKVLANQVGETLKSYFNRSKVAGR